MPAWQRLVAKDRSMQLQPEPSRYLAQFRLRLDGGHCVTVRAVQAGSEHSSALRSVCTPSSGNGMRANQYREASIVFVLPSIGAILDRPVAILLHMACEHVAEQLYFLEVAIKKLAQVGQADVQIVCGKTHIIFWYQPSILRTSSELAITFTLYQPSFPTPQRNLNRWSEEMAS